MAASAGDVIASRHVDLGPAAGGGVWRRNGSCNGLGGARRGVRYGGMTSEMKRLAGEGYVVTELWWLRKLAISVSWRGGHLLSVRQSAGVLRREGSAALSASIDASS